MCKKTKIFFSLMALCGSGLFLQAPKASSKLGVKTAAKKSSAANGGRVISESFLIPGGGVLSIVVACLGLDRASKKSKQDARRKAMQPVENVEIRCIPSLETSGGLTGSDGESIIDPSSAARPPRRVVAPGTPSAVSEPVDPPVAPQPERAHGVVALAPTASKEDSQEDGSSSVQPARVVRSGLSHGSHQASPTIVVNNNSSGSVVFCDDRNGHGRANTSTAPSESSLRTAEWVEAQSPHIFGRRQAGHSCKRCKGKEQVLHSDASSVLSSRACAPQSIMQLTQCSPAEEAAQASSLGQEQLQQVLKSFETANANCQAVQDELTKFAQQLKALPLVAQGPSVADPRGGRAAVSSAPQDQIVIQTFEPKGNLVDQIKVLIKEMNAFLNRRSVKLSEVQGLLADQGVMVLLVHSLDREWMKERSNRDNPKLFLAKQALGDVLAENYQHHQEVFVGRLTTLRALFAQLYKMQENAAVSFRFARLSPLQVQLDDLNKLIESVGGLLQDQFNCLTKAATIWGRCFNKRVASRTKSQGPDLKALLLKNINPETIFHALPSVGITEEDTKEVRIQKYKANRDLMKVDIEARRRVLAVQKTQEALRRAAACGVLKREAEVVFDSQENSTIASFLSSL